MRVVLTLACNATACLSCCAVLCCAVLCLAVLCYAMLCYAMLCCAVLCRAALWHAELLLCCAIPCYAVAWKVVKAMAFVQRDMGSGSGSSNRKEGHGLTRAKLRAHHFKRYSPSSPSSSSSSSSSPSSRGKRPKERYAEDMCSCQDLAGLVKRQRVECPWADFKSPCRLAD